MNKQHTEYKRYDKDGELTREHMNFQDDLDNITSDYLKEIGEILSNYHTVKEYEWDIYKISEVRASAMKALDLDDNFIY